jgi:hypothetical protein
MWQDRLRPCAVFTKTSEGFAPYYLAEIRHDLSQTTDMRIVGARMMPVMPIIAAQAP